MMDAIAESTTPAPKMLIADDDPAIVRLLAERCIKMGFNVDTAANGVQLLLKARRGRPDIMIVDVNMPEMDGLSVCSQLLDPGSKPVDVVVVTGYPHQETIERCKSLGAFYARKGPDFLKNIEAALEEVFPGMAKKIELVAALAKDVPVPAHPRVLVVDDDPAVEIFLASRLSKMGVDTLYAPDAVHAYRIACKEKPTAIISDHYMPNGDAQYLLHRLRTSAVTEQTPVIVLSGKELDELTETNSDARDFRSARGRAGSKEIVRYR